MALPDFLVIGAPKAGSTALHAALAPHPQLHASPVKEPKFYLLPEAPPDRAHQRGPGDRHSSREWIWRRGDYERLFDGAPPGRLGFESTPFYLWDTEAHARIARDVPHAKLIAVIRDPIDRAFSNWTHLWSDGLEPLGNFRAAMAAEQERAAAGWAPFWRYAGLGRYGEQIASLLRYFPREQLKVVRYRRLVEDPAGVLDEISGFLGIEPGVVHTVPGSNVSSWAPNSPGNALLRRTVRVGAAVGAFAPPQVWRTAQRPLLRALQRGHHPRDTLSREVRAELLPLFAEDNALLSDLLGEDYSDWLSEVGRGTYTVRRS